jgi:hypothetical protein
MGMSRRQYKEIRVQDLGLGFRFGPHPARKDNTQIMGMSRRQYKELRVQGLGLAFRFGPHPAGKDNTEMGLLEKVIYRV